MTIYSKIEQSVKQFLLNQDLEDISEKDIIINLTRKDFEGELTVVVFPFVKKLRMNPVKVGEMMGAYLQENLDEISGFSVVQGFLNLSLTDEFWIELVKSVNEADKYGHKPSSGRKMIVEYSSPNMEPLLKAQIQRVIIL